MARKTKAQEIRDWIDKRVKELDTDIKADRHNREAAIEDLKFFNGEQWNTGAIRDRKADGRPYLTINLFPQYVNQVIGDIRHNRPRAKITPNDSEADANIARIREGIISDSEYQSNSDYIYVESGTMMTTCGYGAWRIKTKYSEENPFVQEMYDELIENPFTVIMDSRAKDPMYADANRAFIICKIPREQFEEDYPDAEVPSDNTLQKASGITYENWYDKDTVTVAEYFVRKKEKKMMVQMEDGTVMEEKDSDELIKKWEEKNQELINRISNPASVAAPSPGAMTPTGAPPNPATTPTLPQGQPVSPSLPAGAPVQSAVSPPAAPGAQPNALPVPPLKMPQPMTPRPKVVKRRETEITKVKHYTITACDILSKNELEGEDVPGSMIPIVLITGRRVNIEGKRYISGLVRNAKDSQKNVNYWYSAAAERVALEPKSPWIGTARQFEGYEQDYLQANTRNFPMLKYNPDSHDGTVLPPPQRMGPGQIPAALFQQLNTSLSLFEAAIGMHKSDVGADEGQGRTGAAVYARQKPGDIATFSFMDNLARGIAHGAKIKNSMIPDLYDSQRDVRLRNPDETETWVPINTTVKQAYNAIRSNPERYRGMNTTRLVAAMQKEGPDTKFNDISAGKYAVKVTVGPSYATQRAESAEAMLRIVQANPKMMNLAGDLIFKNLDMRDSDVLSERLKRTLPPGLNTTRPGEVPPPPLPPAPALVLAQKKVELENQRVQLQAAKVQVEKLKMMKEIQSEKGEVKKMLLEMLTELFAPQHPGDALPAISQQEGM